MHIESIILQFFEMGAICFGQSLLKTGAISIGRNITHSPNPKAQAAIYQKAAWAIYKKTRS